jgi:hypothetical protein
MRANEDQLAAEIASLRQQLQAKEAALQNRRAALAETETRLNGRVQELAAELSYERERRRKRERELKTAVSQLALTQTREAKDSQLSAAGEADPAGSGALTSFRRPRTGLSRFSLTRKGRWKSR